MIIDAKTLDVPSAADRERDPYPAHVIIDTLGKLAYVTNSKDDNVLVIDVAQKTVVAKIETDKSPNGLCMSPNRREIYFANVNDTSISVIDTLHSKEVAYRPDGKKPVQVNLNAVRVVA